MDCVSLAFSGALFSWSKPLLVCFSAVINGIIDGLYVSIFLCFILSGNKWN